jgi:hypothetical protein
VIMLKKIILAIFAFVIFPIFVMAADRPLQDSEVTTVDGYSKYPCGMMGIDRYNNQYIYMMGATSSIAHNVVAIDCTSSTTTAAVRLTETVAAKGYPLAIAVSTVTGAQYGWFQIRGRAVVSTYANSKQAEYLASATAGYIAPVQWGGTTSIHGVTFFDAASGSGTAYVIYPHTGN